MLQIKNIDEIYALKGKVLLSFSTQYCVPCKELAPHIEALEKAHGEVTFVKVDAAESIAVSRMFKVMSVPTIILIEDGTVVNMKTSPAYGALEDFLMGN